MSRSPSGTSPLVDPLGEAFHNRGLSHAGVTDEHGVVLGLAGQDLHDAADLAVTADDRVEPAGGRVGDEVTAVLLQRLVRRLRHGGRDTLVASHGGERGQEAVAGEALFEEQPSGRRAGAFVDECDEQMFDGDVVVLESFRFLLGRIEQSAQAWGDAHLAGATPGPLTRGHRSSSTLQVAGQRLRVRSRLLEEPAGEPVGLLEQREKEVFTVDFGVPEPQRLGLSVVQRLLRLLGELIDVHVILRCAGCVAAPATGVWLAAMPIEQVQDQTDRRVVEPESSTQPLDARDAGEIGAGRTSSVPGCHHAARSSQARRVCRASRDARPRSART